MKIHIDKLLQYKKHNVHIVIAVVVFFFLGYLLGEQVQKNNFNKFISTFKNVRAGGNFSLINPLLGSVSSPATDVGIFKDLRNNITDYLEEEKSNGNLYEYSFYFKDLNSPLWFGVNEGDSFSPASLFKLPIAIAVYKQIEGDNKFLNKRLIYTKEIAEINKKITGNNDSNLVIGKDYSVEELVQIMLEFSDNGAKDLLLNFLQKGYVDDLFNVTNLSNPIYSDTYKISSREYSFFLRMLYNSSYLNEEHSEYLLSLLTKSTFKEGIVSGIPKDIVVANKFGAFDTEKKILLHDCGIVYVPEDPFIICFMTHGKDIPTLLKIISNVSKMVYEQENN